VVSGKYPLPRWCGGAIGRATLAIYLSVSLFLSLYLYMCTPCTISIIIIIGHGFKSWYQSKGREALRLGRLP